MTNASRSAKDELALILKRAYSGEMAAAFAYRGHWKSLSRDSEIARVKLIEDEEWVHRRNIAAMLAELGLGPSRALEAKAWVIGRVIGMGCHVLGWFLPMYFAGRLESRNTIEYDEAAKWARELGLADYGKQLIEMSAVEKEHEIFFREIIQGHLMLPLLISVFGWGREASVSTAMPEAAGSAEDRAE